MIESPSVWAGSTWKTCTSSPFQWKVIASVNVTIGSAASGDAGTLRLNASMKCSMLMLLRTFSCATMIAPALPRFSFPPT